MEARPVDPRDIEREMRAVYRVSFWSAGRTRCEEFELTDAADVHEVLGWIDGKVEHDGPWPDHPLRSLRGCGLGQSPPGKRNGAPSARWTASN